MAQDSTTTMPSPKRIPQWGAQAASMEGCVSKNKVELERCQLGKQHTLRGQAVFMTATPDASKLINQFTPPVLPAQEPPAAGVWFLIPLSLHSGVGVRLIVGAGENKIKREPVETWRSTKVVVPGAWKSLEAEPRPLCLIGAR